MAPSQGRSYSRDEIEDSLNHLIPAEPFTTKYFSDFLFAGIASWLRKHPDASVKRWAKNPRIYTLLRMLGHDAESDVFAAFARENICDMMIPIRSEMLHDFIRYGLEPPRFWKFQLLVLSPPESMAELPLRRKNIPHQTVHFGEIYFSYINELGSGGSAKVWRVEHINSGRLFASKSLERGRTLDIQRGQLEEFNGEREILQRMDHKHIVNLVASYGDLGSFSLILEPVAKDVLKSMLDRQSRDNPLPKEDTVLLRSVFGCLATTLAYIHKEKVRHKDIKPSNILISDGKIYFCDFGISRDWSAEDQSTTTGYVGRMTRRYCAPEVLDHDARNSAADIWSLGIVFLELITVIRGYPIHEMNGFLQEQNEEVAFRGLSCAPDAIDRWLVKLEEESSESPADKLPFRWIRAMLRTDSAHRPSAADVVDSIQSDPPQPNLFIGSCCCRADSVSASMSDPLSPSSEPNTAPVDAPDALGIYSRLNPPVRDRHYSRDGSISPGTDINGRRRLDSIDTPSDLGTSPPPNHHVYRPVSSISDQSIRTSGSRGAIPGEPLSPISLFAPAPITPPPAPAPVSAELGCLCAARPGEVHIYNASFTSFSADPAAPTVETCDRCEVGESLIQIYETRPMEPSMLAFDDTSKPDMWWVTRRLVISHLVGDPQARVCKSFWLPLADLHYSREGSQVTLRWSDCNQMTEERLPNYGKCYNWLYRPDQPNNHFTVCFEEAIHAQSFLDFIRLPAQDRVTVRNRRNIEISSTEAADIFDVGHRHRPDRTKLVTNYRAVVISTWIGTDWQSQLFLRPEKCDLDINFIGTEPLNQFQTTDYSMKLVLRRFWKPMYLSDTREQFGREQRVAYFKKAIPEPGGFSLLFPFGKVHTLPAPPSAMITFLYCLTGWRLRYFAILRHLKLKKRHYGSKKYDRSHIMLWEGEIADPSSGARQYAARVTIRIEGKSDDLPWLTGDVDENTSYSHADSDATIKFTNKQRGKCLNISRMVAAPLDSAQTQKAGHSRNSSDVHEERSELHLTFDNIISRSSLEFVTVVQELKDTWSQRKRSGSLASRRKPTFQ